MARPKLLFDVIENKIIPKCSWVMCLVFRCVCKRLKNHIDKCEQSRIRKEFCSLVREEFYNQSYVNSHANWTSISRTIVARKAAYHVTIIGQDWRESSNELPKRVVGRDHKWLDKLSRKKLDLIICQKVPHMRDHFEKLWGKLLTHCGTKKYKKKSLLSWFDKIFARNQDLLLFFRWYCCGIPSKRAWKRYFK